MSKIKVQNVPNSQKERPWAETYFNEKERKNKHAHQKLEISDNLLKSYWTLKIHPTSLTIYFAKY